MMRISTYKDDPGYRTGTHHFDVLLDGESVAHQCVTADEELGEVHLCVRDENGTIKLNQARTGILIEVRRGRVEIRRRDG